jgi:hypothetical protein
MSEDLVVCPNLNIKTHDFVQVENLLGLHLVVNVWRRWYVFLKLSPSRLSTYFYLITFIFRYYNGCPSTTRPPTQQWP